MANPFPGMDPYLEGPLWTTVHSNLVEEIARQLAPKLRPKYLSLTNQRVLVATPDPIELRHQTTRFPDVGVFESGTGNVAQSAGLATAPLIMDALVPEELSQTFVEIRDVQERRLVTTIEVLSPTNKRGDGLDDYRKKRQELLARTAHFMEIDLLRTGERFPVVGRLPSVPYFVFISRVNLRPRVEVWPIAFDEPLPVVPVPLLAGDADASLDLQQALRTVYDLFGYDQTLDYASSPTVPLPTEQEEWARSCLRAAGRIT